MTILLVVGGTTVFCALLMFQVFRSTQCLVSAADKHLHANPESSRRTRERYGWAVNYYRDQGATFHVALPAAMIAEGACMGQRP
jgi:hypothetical protein